MCHTHASTLRLPLRGRESQNSNWYPAPMNQRHTYISITLGFINGTNVTSQKSHFLPYFPIHPYVGPTIISHLYIIEILRKKNNWTKQPQFSCSQAISPVSRDENGNAKHPETMGKRVDEDYDFQLPTVAYFFVGLCISNNWVGNTVYHVYISIINTNSNKDY